MFSRNFVQCAKFTHGALFILEAHQVIPEAVSLYTHMNQRLYVRTSFLLVTGPSLYEVYHTVRTVVASKQSDIYC